MPLKLRGMNRVNMFLFLYMVIVCYMCCVYYTHVYVVLPRAVTAICMSDTCLWILVNTGLCPN